MAFYKSPIRPLDPVVPDEQDNQAIRYVRDNFEGSGQDSYTNPPAQEQSHWERVTNFMPITRKTFDRRWGYKLFTTANSNLGFNYQFTRAFEYQNDATLERKLIWSAPSTVNWYDENFLTSGLGGYVLTPSQGIAPRMINSRSYGYFLPDLVKWDGNVTTSGWGIDVNNVSSSQFGPNTGTIVSDLGGGQNGWLNLGSVATQDGVTADSIFLTPGISNTFQVTNFSMQALGVINGLRVEVFGTYSSGGAVTTFRPTTATAGYASTASAYDNNTTTSANGIDAGSTWSGIPAGPANPNKIKLNVTSQFSSSGGSTATLFYSLNGGSSFTQIYTTSVTRTKTTDTIDVPSNQNLTQVQVKASTSLNGPVGVHRIYEIWMDVTAHGASDPPQPQVNVQLVKNNSAYGAKRSITFSSFTNSNYTFGGLGDLWGGSWIPADINSSSFGVQLTAQTTATNETVSIDAIRVTVFQSGAGVTLGASQAGNVTLTVGRIYYLVAKNSTTGHYSDLTFGSISTGAATNRKFPLTLPVNADPQVDYKALLSTSDGGDPSILYLVTELPNATTTYTDNTVETTLVLNQQYLFTDDFGNDFGVAGNAPPPANGGYALKHKGRLYMSVGQNLYFSKDTSELTLPNGFIAGKYEESWPQDNFMDISEGAETVTALLSDGNILYIGTQRHVRRLFGDGPDNFQKPEIVHQEVGVLNQEVVKMCFAEGSPVGAIWLTPDLRVIRSDFNTYQDLGKPIQDVLNSINLSAVQASHAMFASSGPYDVYILAIPTGSNTTCDTLCVLDLRMGTWGIWNLADNTTAMLFNITSSGLPQFLFSTDGTSTNIYQLQSGLVQDRVNNTPANITSTLRSVWLHLGMPTHRKVLDDIAVVGDPNTFVTIEGAGTQTDFQAPSTIISAAPLILDPFGTNRVFLASRSGKSRYFRFTFATNSQLTDVLDSFVVRAIPFNTL